MLSHFPEPRIWYAIVAVSSEIFDSTNQTVRTSFHEYFPVFVLSNTGRALNRTASMAVVLLRNNSNDPKFYDFLNVVPSIKVVRCDGFTEDGLNYDPKFSSLFFLNKNVIIPQPLPYRQLGAFGPSCSQHR